MTASRADTDAGDGTDHVEDLEEHGLGDGGVELTDVERGVVGAIAVVGVVAGSLLLGGGGVVGGRDGLGGTWAGDSVDDIVTRWGFLGFFLKDERKEEERRREERKGAKEPFLRMDATEERGRWSECQFKGSDDMAMRLASWRMTERWNRGS